MKIVHSLKLHTISRWQVGGRIKAFWRQNFKEKEATTNFQANRKEKANCVGSEQKQDVYAFFVILKLFHKFFCFMTIVSDAIQQEADIESDEWILNCVLK